MDNPILTPDDPYKEEKEKQAVIEEATREFQRKCFEVFVVNKDGAAVMELLRERFLLPRMFDVRESQAANLAMYWEGFKDCLRSIEGHAQAHVKRIQGLAP